MANYQQRAGGNPFDNRDLVYNGTDPDDSASDNDLNDHVARYAADPIAHQYLVRNVTPTTAPCPEKRSDGRSMNWWTGSIMASSPRLDCCRKR
jgi:hypothetical protein